MPAFTDAEKEQLEILSLIKNAHRLKERLRKINDPHELPPIDEAEVTIKWGGRNETVNYVYNIQTAIMLLERRLRADSLEPKDKLTKVNFLKNPQEYFKNFEIYLRQNKLKEVEDPLGSPLLNPQLHQALEDQKNSKLPIGAEEVNNDLIKKIEHHLNQKERELSEDTVLSGHTIERANVEYITTAEPEKPVSTVLKSIAELPTPSQGQLSAAREEGLNRLSAIRGAVKRSGEDLINDAHNKITGGAPRGNGGRMPFIPGGNRLPFTSGGRGPLSPNGALGQLANMATDFIPGVGLIKKTKKYGFIVILLICALVVMIVSKPAMDDLTQLEALLPVGSCSSITGSIGGDCPTQAELDANAKSPNTCKPLNPAINLLDTNVSPQAIQKFIEDNWKKSKLYTSQDSFAQKTNEIVAAAKQAGINPALILGLWDSEGAFTNNFGCGVDPADQSFENELKCATGLSAHFSPSDCVIDALSGNPNSQNCQELIGIQKSHPEDYNGIYGYKVPQLSWDDFEKSYGPFSPILNQKQHEVNNNCTWSYDEHIRVAEALGMCKPTAATSSNNGNIASCQFYKNGWNPEGMPFSSQLLISYINAASQNSGVPANVLAGLVRVEASVQSDTSNGEDKDYSATHNTYTISNYTDSDLQAMSDTSKIDKDIDATIDGTKALCPRSVTGALGLTQIEPPQAIYDAIRNQIITSNKALNRNYIVPPPFNQLGSYDVNAANKAAQMIGKQSADQLTVDDFCDPQKSILMGAGFLLEKMGGSWDSSKNQDETYITKAASVYYGNDSQTSQYQNSLWRSVSGCPVPPTQASSSSESNPQTPTASGTTSTGFRYLTCPLDVKNNKDFQITCGTKANPVQLPGAPKCGHGGDGYDPICKPPYECNPNGAYTSGLTHAIDVTLSSKNDSSGAEVRMPYVNGNESVTWKPDKNTMPFDKSTQKYEPIKISPIWGNRYDFVTEYQGHTIGIHLEHLQQTEVTDLASGDLLGYLMPTNQSADFHAHVHIQVSIDGKWIEAQKEAGICSHSTPTGGISTASDGGTNACTSTYSASQATGTFFCQWDPKWANEPTPHGKDCGIGYAGCGPSTTAMVLARLGLGTIPNQETWGSAKIPSSVRGQPVNPPNLTQIFMANGWWEPYGDACASNEAGGAIPWLKTIKNDNNNPIFSAVEIPIKNGILDIPTVQKYLNEQYLIIASQNLYHMHTGHIFGISSIDSGKIRVFDPNNCNSNGSEGPNIYMDNNPKYEWLYSWAIKRN